MIHLALEFSDQVSVGNIISIAIFLISGVGAFYSLREMTKTNRYLIDILTKRFDACEIEKMADRVTTMWAFQLRRGMGELESKGYGKRP